MRAELQTARSLQGLHRSTSSPRFLCTRSAFIGVVVGRTRSRQPLPPLQRACVRCKNLKVKCEVKSINEIVADPCRRCRNAGYECLLPGTKKRKAPPCVLPPFYAAGRSYVAAESAATS
jgi:hypothetical protein